MSGTEVVRLRPQRVRVVCYVAAVAVLAVFTLVGVGLSGRMNQQQTTVFHLGDQIAMIGLGVLAAIGVLWFTRPRVEADAQGVRVRNLAGAYQLPWEVVRSIRFDQHSPWAFLELADDESVAMLAVQTADKDYAVQGVRALRALHHEATSRDATPRQ
ncbi:PH domain-containing protein [Catenuloplanes japonicus]|uniref:PH domain-containing protein n=1 Tax=Catenuloplanes japonicus TaxID=33876 RepID=UPI00052715CE|nr:PH domain-containing protein [Catenuloplanes japonicus]